MGYVESELWGLILQFAECLVCVRPGEYGLKMTMKVEARIGVKA